MDKMKIAEELGRIEESMRVFDASKKAMLDAGARIQEIIIDAVAVGTRLPRGWRVISIEGRLGSATFLADSEGRLCGRGGSGGYMETIKRLSKPRQGRPANFLTT